MNTNKRPLRKEMPKRNSIVAFFVVGALLLVIPLALILTAGSPCASPSDKACVSSTTYKQFVSALPYVMIVGGVLIAYNLKRVSDSLLPPPEEEGEAQPEGTSEH